MPSLAFKILFLSVLLVVTPTQLLAKRVALVIGNGAYAHADVLRNPSNDARAMSEKLKSFGFDVMLGTDLKQAEFRQIVRSFSKKVSRSDVALLYYAGHGIQADGENYLIPIDGNIEISADLRWNTVSLRNMMREMQAPGRTTIVILDACRNNPLATRLRSITSDTRSMNVGRGLARMVARRGSYLAFATAPGEVAGDGEGDHSPFTSALLKQIDVLDLDIALLMRRVRLDVQEATGGRQTPWSNSSLLRDFSFNQRGRPTKATAKAVRPANDARKPAPILLQRQVELPFWNSVKDSDDPEVIQTYLNRYPDGAFSELAALLIGKLSAAKKAAIQELGRTKSKEKSANTEKGSVASDAVKVAAVAEASVGSSATTPLGASNDSSVPAASPREDDPGLLVRKVQQELKRLGCYDARVDGKWGRKSAASLNRFAKHANTKLPQRRPSINLLNILEAATGRACPKIAARPSKTTSRDRSTKSKAAVTKKKIKQVSPKKKSVAVKRKAKKKKSMAECMHEAGGTSHYFFSVCMNGY